MVFTCLFALLSCESIAADTPPSPTVPGAPAARPAGTYSRPVPIGPKDSTEVARPLSGKVMLVANAPREIEAASVDFALNDKPLGSVPKRPFVLEFDTTGVADGEHAIRSTARDGSGKEIWSAVARVRVNNSSPVSDGNPGPGTPGERPARDRRPPRGDRGGPAPELPTDDVGTAADPDHANDTPPAAANGVAAPALDKTYSSSKYGFSISYPGAWIVRDDTEKKKTAEPGGFWVVLGPDPVDDAPMVVNIHRRKLNPGTDAETFARYNEYVRSWDRKTLKNGQAFATSSGTPQAKDVIHRTIIVAAGSAWMFNLTDRTGAPAAESAALFANMLASFRPTAK